MARATCKNTNESHMELAGCFLKASQGGTAVHYFRCSAPKLNVFGISSHLQTRDGRTFFPSNKNLPLF